MGEEEQSEVKTNHRRGGAVDEDGYDYARNMFRARIRVGLGAAVDGGRWGSAKDIAEQKRHDRVKSRREAERKLKRELRQL
jgi:hypothetical protein